MSEEIKQGKLYLCATPIGNLEDITYRVVRILKEVDIIGAEDTRNSVKLLNHFEIKTPMTSYHEFNKYDKAKQLVQMMLNGKNVAIITDAGTPGISDPGEELVRQCYEAGIEVSSLPGAAAFVTALTMSGQKTRRFCFEAFLPSDKKEKSTVLEELKNETRTIVIYEAPHRLVRTLKELRDALGNRSITLCRELTKKYEEADKIWWEDEDSIKKQSYYLSNLCAYSPNLHKPYKAYLEKLEAEKNGSILGPKKSDEDEYEVDNLDWLNDL